jgi:hypothetical protein
MSKFVECPGNKVFSHTTFHVAKVLLSRFALVNICHSFHSLLFTQRRKGWSTFASHSLFSCVNHFVSWYVLLLRLLVKEYSLGCSMLCYFSKILVKMSCASTGDAYWQENSFMFYVSKRWRSNGLRHVSSWLSIVRVWQWPLPSIGFSFHCLCCMHAFIGTMSSLMP